MEILKLLTIDHLNKKDLIVTVPYEVIRMGMRNIGDRDIDVLEAVKKAITVDVLKGIFELKNEYDAEYYASVPTSINLPSISIVLTRK